MKPEIKDRQIGAKIRSNVEKSVMSFPLQTVDPK